ncbi:MAG: Maf family protein [Pseudohongiellaceae bacterium]
MTAGDKLLYLASASPRRREILAQMGVHYEMLAQDVDEALISGEAADAYVLRMARSKVQAALQGLRADSPALVLGADTCVVIDGRILGKPESQQHGLEMLHSLSGRMHQVLTAVAVADSELMHATLSHTSVKFRTLTDEEIMAYWSSGEPRDKAGSYGIQGLGAILVESIRGSYSNVVGLPVFETADLLGRFGISLKSLLQGPVHEC